VVIGSNTILEFVDRVMRTPAFSELIKREPRDTSLKI